PILNRSLVETIAACHSRATSPGAFVAPGEGGTNGISGLPHRFSASFSVAFSGSRRGGYRRPFGRVVTQPQGVIPAREGTCFPTAGASEECPGLVAGMTRDRDGRRPQEA